MSFLDNIPLVGGFLGTLLPFLIVIAIVVFVHEYGHYIVGRWCGIHAETFSLGFGPVIWARTDRRGTRWQVAAIPLGGYVKFLGDRNAASQADDAAFGTMNQDQRARSFPGAAVWRRALTVAAGPVANFILAIAVYAGLAIYSGVGVQGAVVGAVAPLPQELPLRTGDEIVRLDGQEVASYSDIYDAVMAAREAGASSHAITLRREGAMIELSSPFLMPPRLNGVEPLSPADRAGLREGDVVLSANGQTLASFRDLGELIVTTGEAPIEMIVWRAGELLDLTVTPQWRDFPAQEGGFTRRIMVGISGSLAFDPYTRTPGALEALGIGASRTINVLYMSLDGIRHMITGDLGVENLQGPIGIAQISGRVANQGLDRLIGLIALLSAAIGMINLFPIPVLDGGHLVAHAYEALRGRPPSAAFMNVAMLIGLAMVLFIMAFATYNDILRL